VHILVLNRFALRLVPYRDYIDPAFDCTLITSSGGVSSDPEQRARQLAGYAKAVVLEDYANLARLEYTAHRLHAERNFDGIVAMSEYDLLTAARLRRAWGIAGQTLESTLAYRDKFLMKQTLAAAGVPVATFAKVDHVSDLVAFIGRVGLPVVVKPRRGAGSVDVRVLRTDDDVNDFLGAGSSLTGDHPADLQAERYIPHEMYNVDGMVINGELRVGWPSATTSGLLYQQGDLQRATFLEPGEAPQPDLVALLERVLAALPTPRNTVFHAEMFRTTDGSLMLNEIGCRIGGARVWDQFRLGFDVDLIGSVVKANYGVDRDGPVVGAKPVALSGWAMVACPPGVVRSVPADCPVPNVWIYDSYVAAGDTIAPPVESTDAVAAFVAQGETRAACDATLQKAVAWYQSTIEIEPARPGG